TLVPGAVINISGATINGSLTISSNAVLNWSGGDLEGALTVAQGGTLTISNTVYFAQNNYYYGYTNTATLDNYGTVVWAGTITASANYYGGGGGIIYNAGLWESVADNSLGFWGYSGTNSLFLNTGTLEKTGGTGTSTMDWNFNNSGGTVLPLDGTVGFDNGLNLTNGLLSFAISGPSSFGKISVSGPANLSGTLSANLNSGYSPPVTTSFQLITYGSESGVFTNLNLPALGTGLGWQVLYGASAVSVQVV